ncbi:MAG TPA: hypothetical protein VK186_14335, partial [Candidatus Deferrimicrobium sp.]|nr:hypothetical protein [Candidatus Deferrimicrobium sp.]
GRNPPNGSRLRQIFVDFHIRLADFRQIVADFLIRFVKSSNRVPKSAKLFHRPNQFCRHPQIAFPNRQKCFIALFDFAEILKMDTDHGSARRQNNNLNIKNHKKD